MKEREKSLKVSFIFFFYYRRCRSFIFSIIEGVVCFLLLLFLLQQVFAVGEWNKSKTEEIMLSHLTLDKKEFKKFFALLSFWGFKESGKLVMDRGEDLSTANNRIIISAEKDESLDHKVACTRRAYCLKS